MKYNLLVSLISTVVMFAVEAITKTLSKISLRDEQFM